METYKALRGVSRIRPRAKAMLVFLVIVALWWLQARALPSFAALPTNALAQQLRTLVDSFANRAIFAQLNAHDAFYDRATGVVGTVRPADGFQHQPYVANGYIGARIPRLGHGFARGLEQNGWPLFNTRYAGAFVAGFFNAQQNTLGTNFPELLEHGYESVISAVPQWTTLQISLDGQAVGADVSNYVQNLSLADGVVATSYTWRDTVRVKYTVFAHRLRPSLGVVAVELYNVLLTPIAVTVTDELDFATAQRATFKQAGADKGIFLRYSPLGVDYIEGATYSVLHHAGARRSNTSRAARQSVTVQLPPYGSDRVLKTVGIATTDLGGDVLATAQRVASTKESFEQLLALHRAAWAELHTDIGIPDDPLLEMAARASVFHLNANTRPDAHGVTAALGVAGLSSDSYGGMVFWDTDLWILGGLLPFSPAHARSLVNYRVHTHKQALRNLEGPYVPKANMLGAAYPWTSGRFGNCTATGPCFNYEYHINVAVALSALNVYLSGAGDEAYLEHVAYPLIRDAALFLADFVTYNASLLLYTLHNLTDPDEYANHVDNGAYTNAGISATLRWASAVLAHLGKPVPPHFGDIAGNVHLPLSPLDPNLVLEYTGMNALVGIKQADVIMVTYPLENEMITPAQARTNMDFYLMKQVNFGPAMTYPIFLIVALALLDTGCALTLYLLKAVQPFLRAPFAQFSEQNNDDYATNGGTHPAFPFMTAHGGLLQALVQGLLGLRFDFEVELGRMRRVLKLDPVGLDVLPNGVYIGGVRYLNSTLELNLTRQFLHVRNRGPNTVDIRLGERNEWDAVLLKPGARAAIPVYNASLSFPGSLSECGRAAFTNVTEGAFGDATVSVNDGDNTTHWQSVGARGVVLADLGRDQRVLGVVLNWGDMPPRNLSVYAADELLLKSTLDVLSKVDFGVDFGRRYAFYNPKEESVPFDEAFAKVYAGDVVANAPHVPPRLALPTLYNTTQIGLDTVGRFLVFEFAGEARLHEINIY